MEPSILSQNSGSNFCFSSMSSSWLSHLKAQKAIAVIRAASPDLGLQMAQAVAAGGMELIEVTWNSDQPAQLLHRLQAELPHCCIGAGTLLTPADLQAAINAGAEFLFTPHLSLAMIQQAVAQQIPILPGALTPTEILSAWQAGATCVKVFPIETMGGAAYIQHLQGPMRQVPLIPTGGVTLENAADLITAGAVAVGLAGALFPKQAIAQGNWEAVQQRASLLLQALRTIESQSPAAPP